MNARKKEGIYCMPYIYCQYQFKYVNFMSFLLLHNIMKASNLHSITDKLMRKSDFISKEHVAINS